MNVTLFLIIGFFSGVLCVGAAVDGSMPASPGERYLEISGEVSTTFHHPDP